TWKGQTVSNACYEFFHESEILETHLRRKRKHNELAEGYIFENALNNTISQKPQRETQPPPPRSPNNGALLDIPNKRQMSDEKVIQYLNAMEQSLEYNQVTMQRPSLWTESLNSYVNNVLKVFSTDISVRVFDDKVIFHAEVSSSPSSSSSQHVHAVNDTTKSIHIDIMNLIAILLDHLRAPVENATKIKVFSLQAI
ncbi:13923_t:CDS:2, partial [Acaulospora morrowiae]